MVGLLLGFFFSYSYIFYIFSHISGVVGRPIFFGLKYQNLISCCFKGFYWPKLKGEIFFLFFLINFPYLWCFWSDFQSYNRNRPWWLCNSRRQTYPIWILRECWHLLPRALGETMTTNYFLLLPLCLWLIWFDRPI